MAFCLTTRSFAKPCRRQRLLILLIHNESTFLKPLLSFFLLLSDKPTCVGYLSFLNRRQKGRQQAFRMKGVFLEDLLLKFQEVQLPYVSDWILLFFWHLFRLAL
jgi:hypothetical protein